MSRTKQPLTDQCIFSAKVGRRGEEGEVSLFIQVQNQALLLFLSAMPRQVLSCPQEVNRRARELMGSPFSLQPSCPWEHSGFLFVTLYGVVEPGGNCRLSTRPRLGSSGLRKMCTCSLVPGLSSLSGWMGKHHLSREIAVWTSPLMHRRGGCWC